MNSTPPSVIIAPEGFALRPELSELAERKAEKLRRHRSPTIGHIRLHVKREAPHGAPVQFVVCATAETGGPDFIAHAAAEEPEVAIAAAFTKLDRAANEVAGARKVARHRVPAEAGVRAAYT
jgi:ribosome-associated translation inhibitor RaiA